MYLKVYLKALLSGFNEIFELIGKVQSFVAAFFAVVAIFYTASFTAWLEPVKPYYPKLLLTLFFMALFISGYRAWVKIYKKQEVKCQKKTEITVIKADCVIRSYTTRDKIHNIGLSLTFVVTNFNDHPIHVKGFDFVKIKEGFGFDKMADVILPNNKIFPVSVGSNNIKEFHFSPAYDIKNLSFLEQIHFLKEISGKTYYTTAEIISINGKEIIDVKIDFDNTKLLIFLKENSYEFNQSIIDSVL
ncbi:hypothetical protein XB02_10510 [Pantoea ananatis]|nr:hypothetical protein XB02_10510 [Pantoea ananatis]